MTAPYTLSYSVCTPGDPFPVEVKATGDRVEALALAATIPGAVVYDWSTGEQVTA